MPEEENLLCEIGKKYNMSLIGIAAFRYVILMLVIYYMILGNQFVINGYRISIIIVGIIGIAILILDKVIANICYRESNLP